MNSILLDIGALQPAAGIDVPITLSALPTVQAMFQCTHARLCAASLPVRIISAPLPAGAHHAPAQIAVTSVDISISQHPTCVLEFAASLLALTIVVGPTVGALAASVNDALIDTNVSL